MLSLRHANCNLCPHQCRLKEGETGICKGRRNINGKVRPIDYGAYSAVSLDSIEKKPFYHFFPGSTILSVGGYGCNMKCFYCQNSVISQTSPPQNTKRISPRALVDIALSLRIKRNIGLAFTYNEPLINYEFVFRTAKRAKKAGLKTVLITNGFFMPLPFSNLLPFIDACNIDLKCFNAKGYEKLGGRLSIVKDNIITAAKSTHVEVTSLIAPGLFDDENQMEELSVFLSGISKNIPLHISRYFPCYMASDPATDLEKLKRLHKIARKHLRRVYLGNMPSNYNMED